MVIDHQQFTALHSEAKKHTSFESFRDEMLRLTESVWHHHRAELTKVTSVLPGPDEEQQPVEDEAVIQSGAVDPVPAEPVQPEQPAAE